MQFQIDNTYRFDIGWSNFVIIILLNRFDAISLMLFDFSHFVVMVFNLKKNYLSIVLLLLLELLDCSKSNGKSRIKQFIRSCVCWKSNEKLLILKKLLSLCSIASDRCFRRWQRPCRCEYKTVNIIYSPRVTRDSMLNTGLNCTLFALFHIKYDATKNKTPLDAL